MHQRHKHSPKIITLITVIMRIINMTTVTIALTIKFVIIIFIIGLVTINLILIVNF